jgi:adenylate cyclase class 2
MLEVEIKFRVDDHAAVFERLRSENAKLIEERDDADSYFNAPHRDFAKTDEAVRVRQIGTRNFVTYKGPRIDSTTKTRTEIEVPLAGGPEAAADFKKLLAALGFRPVAVVRKHRRIFELSHAGFDVEVSLDDVANVGRYAEVEIQADENQLESARAALQDLAAKLGLTDSERRSYLELLLANTRSPI